MPWPWQKGASDEGASLLRGSDAGSVATPGRVGMVLAACSFANGVIGAGIIGLPGALNGAGFALGIALCLLVGSLSAYTIKLLGYTAMSYDASSYGDLCQRAFGAPGYWVLSVMQILFAFGCCCSYLVIFCDTLLGVLHDTASWTASRVQVLAVGGILLMLPLSLFRRYSSLAYLSLLKMAAMGLLVFTVAWYRFHIDVPTVKTAEWKYEEAHANVLPAIGTIAFAFVAHHQSWLLLGSLQNPTKARFGLAVNLAITTSCTLSILLACFGYTTFFEQTRGDIFVNYEAIAELRGSPLMNTARILLALNMCLVLPTEMMVLRSTIESLIQRFRRHARWLALRAPVFDVVLLAQLQKQQEEEDAQSADNWRWGKPITRSVVEHVLLTVALFFAAFGVSLSTSDLQKVLGLTGSFTAVFLAFVLPAAIRLRLGVGPYDARPLCHVSNLPVWLVLTFGGVAFVASTGYSLVQLAEG